MCSGPRRDSIQGGYCDTWAAWSTIGGGYGGGGGGDNGGGGGRWHGVMAVEVYRQNKKKLMTTNPESAPTSENTRLRLT